MKKLIVSPLRLTVSQKDHEAPQKYQRTLDIYLNEQQVLAHDEHLLERVIPSLPNLVSIEIAYDNSIGRREINEVFGSYLRLCNINSTGDWTIPLISRALRAERLNSTDSEMGLICRGGPLGPALYGMSFFDPSKAPWNNVPVPFSGIIKQTRQPLRYLTHLEIHNSDDRFHETAWDEHGLFTASHQIFEDAHMLERITISGAQNSKDFTNTGFFFALAFTPLRRLRTLQMELFPVAADGASQALRTHERTIEVVKFTLIQDSNSPPQANIIMNRLHNAITSLAVSGLTWAMLKTIEIDTAVYDLGVFELAPFLKGQVSTNPILFNDLNASSSTTPPGS